LEPGVVRSLLQRLGQHLDAGLGDIVGGIAGRRGDSLLGSRVHHDCRLALRNHRRHERETAVVDAAEVRFEDSLPAVRVLVRAAAPVGLDGRVVHEQVHLAPLLERQLLRHQHLSLEADVALLHEGVLRAGGGALIRHRLGLVHLDVAQEYLHF